MGSSSAGVGDDRTFSPVFSLAELVGDQLETEEKKENLF